LRNVLKRINLRKIIFYALYIFLALVLQNMLLGQIRILGVSAMVLPAAAVAMGMFEGASWGAVLGLILGFFSDMAYIESTVMFTLVFPCLAFAAGFLTHFFINKRFFAFMGIAIAALAITAGIQGLKILAAEGWSMDILYTAVLQFVLSLVPAALAYFPPAKML